MPNADVLPEWVRAYGNPVVRGLVRQSAGDFVVDEELSFLPAGDGEHDLLRVEKTGANTSWVARALARHAKVPLKDVGYAGLKDRHAVTKQWFSVRRPNAAGTDWEQFSLDGVKIVEAVRHNRKLRRGAHAGNHFRLIVRRLQGDTVALTERLEQIRAGGVPNYFGPQRFGNNGGNLRLVESLVTGCRMKREQRGIALSTARSFLFNEILSGRVAIESWNEITVGEAVNLDGTRSFFKSDCVDESLLQRNQAMDVHPTCALWGRGELECSGKSADLEQDVADQFPDLVGLLEDFDLSQARRASRLVVSDLEWLKMKDALQISFRLCGGGYATSVLREILQG